MKILCVLPILNCAGSATCNSEHTRRERVTTQPYRATFVAAATTVLLAVLPAPAQTVPAPTVGDIFVIAMENHNFTQSTSLKKRQQILGNPAAPLINSLVT